MADKYKVRFLPAFSDDLNDAVDYIRLKLKNTEAANRLIDNIEAAIEKRSLNPEAFEQYHSLKESTCITGFI